MTKDEILQEYQRVAANMAEKYKESYLTNDDSHMDQVFDRLAELSNIAKEMGIDVRSEMI